MGMNEGEPTDELRLAAEIADMDPSTIDSLRRGTPSAAPAEQQQQQQPKPPSNPFGVPPTQLDLPPVQQPRRPQPPPPFGSAPASIGGAAGGFLNSVKKAASAASSSGSSSLSIGGSSSSSSSSSSTGGGSSFRPLVNGGVESDMMSGPRAYVIPQDDRETPLEIRSVPTPRRSQKGVIAEVPGRRLPKRPGRVDLGEKMAEVKRTLKEAPTRLTEIQTQNLRNNMGPNGGGGGTSTATPPSSGGKQKGKDGGGNSPFTFPSFPVQLPTQQQSQQQPKAPAQSPFAGLGGGAGSSSSKSGGRRGLKRRGSWGAGAGSGRPSQKSSLPAWSRDWRVIVGAIAAVSFVGALLSSLGSRSELIVMESGGPQAGGVTDFLLQNAAELGADVDKLFV